MSDDTPPLPAAPRIRRGVIRAGLLAVLGTGLWLAGASAASAGEPAPPATPFLSATGPAEDPVADVAAALAEPIRTVAEPAVTQVVAPAVEPVATSVARPVVPDAVEPVVTGAVAPVVTEVVRATPDVVEALPAVEGPGVVPGGPPLPDPLPGPPPGRAGAPEPAPPADAPTGSPGSPADAGASRPASPPPVAPPPFPAAPAPSGSGGTSGPAPDGGSAVLPGSLPAAVLLAEGGRHDAASDAVRSLSTDPSSSPD